MKMLTAFVVFISLTLSLQAYSKKIILLSFYDAKKGVKILDAFMADDEKSSSLKKLAEDNQFKIYTRKSGKQYIIVAEPITDKAILKQALKLARKNFKGAYFNNSTASKVVMKKIEDKSGLESSQKKLEIEKKELEVVVTKVVHPVVNQRVVAKKVIVEKKQTQKQEDNISLTQEMQTEASKESNEFSSWQIFKWLLLFTILSAMTFYFIKFKRIYDEY